MRDSYGREINYMRISITDRCNLRCRYCMPYGASLVSRGEILTYEEIEIIAKAAIRAGITRFKITGGEPLVRRNCPQLIRRLKSLSGVEQVTLTTNGVLLEQHLQKLVDAGLDAVNISLDTLDAERYEQITGKNEFGKVLSGIEAAVKANLKVKINVVLQKDVNDKDWISMVELAKVYPLDVRFIEMMPIGLGKQFATISNEELLAKLMAAYKGIQKDVSIRGNGPAVYYQIPGFQGTVGFISAIHGKFCENCNRIRLTAKGQLKPCLCYGESVDFRKILRTDHSDNDLCEASSDNLCKVSSEHFMQTKEEQVFGALQTAILQKPKQHCFEVAEEITEDRRMDQIGG